MATASEDLVSQAQMIQTMLFNLHRTLDGVPAPLDSAAVKSAHDQISTILGRWITSAAT